MSSIKKEYDIDQPAGFVLVNSGPSIAVGTNTKGKDSISETVLAEAQPGGSVPAGFVNSSNSIAISTITVTVV